MAVSRPKTVKGQIDLHEIKRLLEMIERSPITEFELVDKDLKIRISKNGTPSQAVHMVQAPSMPVPTAHAPVSAPVSQETAPAPEAKKAQYVDVKSPMVGTFYRAQSPDAEPYVRIGDTVEPGKVLCIVEAMKLMNELESEVRGRVAEILVENAQPVEFGQVIFRIDTSAA
jgi:acetyl-CoA carboxylase biotin carboxyl carrier protein